MGRVGRYVGGDRGRRTLAAVSVFLCLPPAAQRKTNAGAAHSSTDKPIPTPGTEGRRSVWRSRSTTVRSFVTVPHTFGCRV